VFFKNYLYLNTGVRISESRFIKNMLCQVWWVELLYKKLEIYHHPESNGYWQILITESDENIAPELLPEAEINTNILW